MPSLGCWVSSIEAAQIRVSARSRSLSVALAIVLGRYGQWSLRFGGVTIVSTLEKRGWKYQWLRLIFGNGER